MQVDGLESGRAAGSVPTGQTSGIVGRARKIVPLDIALGTLEDADRSASSVQAPCGSPPPRVGRAGRDVTLDCDDQGEDVESEVKQLGHR